MHFLITNDDGFDAPGLAALYHALSPLGRITVVAPAVCHSSRGHAVDTKNPIRVEHRQLKPFNNLHVVHASPADCIRVGLKHILRDPPDCVVAGINPGANLGVDLFYSGTAAAAREAALLGTPAIALSRLIHPDFPIDWNVLAQHATHVVQTLLSQRFRLPAGHFWNVNFPTVPNENYPSEITVVPQGTGPHAVQFKVIEDSPDSQTLAYTASYRDRLRSGECDVHHLFEQRLTATPVGPSLTAEAIPPLYSAIPLIRAASAD
jgi:5'-nucleotidase